MTPLRVILVLVVAGAIACTSAPPSEPPQSLPPGAEAVSLLGAPLVAPPLAADVQTKREEDLSRARADYEKNPNDPDAIIWVGRRLAYLGRFRDAIATFTEGIRKHPGDARFYRHRGHRFITVREFDRAIADFERATALVQGKPDEVEPDGQPNARNIPIGSLQSNICYHLGLAHYLKGDFEVALPVYQTCHTLSTNPDRLVSTAHWLYMTLRRLGRTREAEEVLQPISPGMDIIENVAYHKLLMLYSGDIAPQDLLREDPATIDGATILYGVGNWYLYNGEEEKALPLFRRIGEGTQWPAFAFIAAEAEISRQERVH